MVEGAGRHSEGTQDEAPASERLNARDFAGRSGVVDEVGIFPDTGQGLWVVRAR